MNWRLWWIKASRWSVLRDNWYFICGPDIWNEDFGFTFKYGQLPPMNDWRRWRYEFRFNIRWPVQLRLRRSRC